MKKSTWESLSKETYGYVAEQTQVNEQYVVTQHFEKLVQNGATLTEIALRWNQGHAKRGCSKEDLDAKLCVNGYKCKRGENDYGVKYDSCAYVAMVIKNS